MNKKFLSDLDEIWEERVIYFKKNEEKVWWKVKQFYSDNFTKTLVETDRKKIKVVICENESKNDLYWTKEWNWCWDELNWLGYYKVPIDEYNKIIKNIKNPHRYNKTKEIIESLWDWCLQVIPVDNIKLLN